MATRTEILDTFLAPLRKDLTPGDWRIERYSNENWQVGAMTKKVALRKQGINLVKGGTVVFSTKNDEDGFVTVYVPGMMMAARLKASDVKAL